MRILFILIPSAPEERSHAAVAFDGSVGEVQGHDHGFVDFGPQGDVVGGEGIGLFGILLQAGRGLLVVVPRAEWGGRGLASIACWIISVLHLEVSVARKLPKFPISSLRVFNFSLVRWVGIPFD